MPPACRPDHGHPAPQPDYCASVSPSVRSVSPIVRRARLSVSCNVRRNGPSIAPRAPDVEPAPGVLPVLLGPGCHVSRVVGVIEGEATRAFWLASAGLGWPRSSPGTSASVLRSRAAADSPALALPARAHTFANRARFIWLMLPSLPHLVCIKLQAGGIQLSSKVEPPAVVRV